MRCAGKLGIPLDWGRISRGPSWVTSRVSSTLSCFQRECGISLYTLLWNRASSRVERRISWFFSSCGGKLGVPLDLRWGPPGPARVASEKSGLFSSCKGPVWIPHKSLPINRAVSRVQSGNSVFSPVATGISGFLSRFNKGVRPRLVLKHGTLHSSRVLKGLSGLQSSSGREFGLFQEDR